MARILRIIRFWAEARPARYQDNDSIPADRLTAAIAIGRQAIAAADQRADIVASEGLDAAFCLPGHIWTDDETINDYAAAYRSLKSLAPEKIAVLRLRSQVFSGFSLVAMRPSRGLSSVVSLEGHRLAARPAFRDVLGWGLLTEKLPTKYWIRPPNILGETGWWIDGVMVSADTRGYQERVTLLHHAGVLDRSPTEILEIGGGYGALAYALTDALPNCRYYICDLPESLLFSGLYLAAAGRSVSFWPSVAGRIVLVPNYRFQDIVARLGEADLAINTLSMAEMTPHQIDVYAEGLAKLLGTSGVFFEQNFHNLPQTDVTPILDRHFRQRSVLSLPLGRPRRGLPHLWSNSQAVSERRMD